MGIHQLRFVGPLTPDPLQPFVGQVVQVTLRDGTAHHGTLTEASPAGLRLSLTPRLAPRLWPWPEVRALIVDGEAAW